MKALKKWLRDWLRDEEWVAELEQKRIELSLLEALLKTNMIDDALRVHTLASDVEASIKQRAPKPMWRKFDREALGPDYGRIASAASTAAYPILPAMIDTGQVRMALPSALVLPHTERGFVAMQHIPIHPHHKMPAFDFGDTEAQALFNLSQQLAQIALHEGWSLTLSEN